MKIDLNKSLLDLAGKEIEGTTLGQTIANLLANSAEGDSVKFMIWAMKLYKGDAIDLDRADAETLKKFIEHSRTTPNFVKSAALNQIIDAQNRKEA